MKLVINLQTELLNTWLTTGPKHLTAIFDSVWLKKKFITCTNVLFIHSGLFDQNMVVTLKVNIFHDFTT